jgi:predicted HD superfamily hydrolase involved in NAD metabolism
VTLEERKEKLGKSISQKRYIHSINVMNIAKTLAKLYKIDEDKAMLAGLLHDCAKNLLNEDQYKMYVNLCMEIDEITKKETGLLHGAIGAKIAKEHYKVTDKEVLDAIRYHTTGKEDMTLMEKIIFISDYIEPGRNFAGVEEIRKWAYKDINKAMLLAFDITIRRVLDKGALLHPSTLKARNFLIMQNI